MMPFQPKRAYGPLGGVCVAVVLLGVASISLAEEGGWTQKADMPRGRYVAGSAVVDGRIYIIGGGPVYSGITAAVDEYTPATDTWTRRTAMPTARRGVVAAAVDGIIYAIGGLQSGHALSTVEVYDPATDTWTTKADMPTGRTYLAACVVDGRIYVIGGADGDFNGRILSTIESYDPATDTWAAKADMPTARAFPAACVVDGRIYVSGGSTRYFTLPPAVPTVEVYDPATDAWTQTSDMPMAKWGHSASVVDGKMYIVGGANSAMIKLFEEGKLEQDELDELFSIVDVYDPATDTWTTAASLPTSRFKMRHAAAVVDGKIYTIGGSGPENIILSMVDKFDPGLGVTSVDVTDTFGATWVGQTTLLEVTVEVERPLEETEALGRMMLDLSPLGLPSELPLEHAGGGRYTGSTALTPLQTGHYDLPILVETRDGERYWLRTVSLDVYPQDEYLYQDAVGSRWEVGLSSGGESDPAASAMVHGGSYAQAVTLPRESTVLRYIPTDPDGFSTFGYTTLEFWIQPGTASTDQASLALRTGEGFQSWTLGEDLGIALAPDAWQVVSIPLRDLGVVDARLQEIQLRGIVGTFYLDDVALVVAEYRLAEASARPSRIKADGTMSTLLSVHAVPGVEQPDAPPAVTVDLTPIGGMPDAVMVDDGTGGDRRAGDGIYSRQTTVDPPIRNGPKELVITATDHRLRQVRTYLPVGVIPSADRYLYQDQVEPGWNLKLYRTDVDSTCTEYVYEGSHACAVTFQPEQTILYMDYQVEDPDGLPTFGYEALVFWLNPGSAAIEELTLEAMSRQGRSSVSLVAQRGLSLEAERWQPVRVPCALLGLADTDLWRIRFTGAVEGTFYLDDIRLVVETPTAVEEASVAIALPLGYALFQNYPNPFNSETMIRFALPVAGDVELALFNLAGQRVATLVQGMRSAGTYAVRWDGRDEEGQVLASGVYLYRLQAGNGKQVETRKLLLVR